jgi:hypothetical protein
MTQRQAKLVQPFPDFGAIQYTLYSATGNYNAFQATLDSRFEHGVNFLATYTFSHSLDDQREPLASTGDSGYADPALVGIARDYSNSPLNVRHRVTLNGNYQLPVGSGRKYLSDGGLVDQVVGVVRRPTVQG